MKRILLFLCFSLLLSNSIIGQVPQSERNALIDLYNATNGSNWTNNTNWNTANPVSTWFGVTTQVINTVEHVTFISLGDNNLEPNLPASIGNLSELIGFQVLNTVNQFGPGGSIPSTIGNLSKLQDFTVRGWNLSGAIPNEIGNISSLTTLDIRESSFSGSLPSSISNLSNLQILAINNNNFSGAFPNVTGLPLIFLRIQSNNFQFGDFENEFSTYQSNINVFTFSPQKPNNVSPNNFLVSIGDTVPLNSATISGFANQYQWFLNSQLVNGANSPNLNLTNIQANQFGTYQCIVTSNLVPGLSILAGTFEVSQTPQNVDVISATEITSFPYNENNIRLDLATNDTGGQGGCNFTANPTIYYKFTATQNATISAQISDSSGSTLGFTNAIIYTASDLNATNNSQLQVATFCGQSSFTNLFVTQGQSYYIIFLRVNGGSNFTNISFNEVPDVPQVERDALLEFYNATNGSNWTNNANWNTNTPVSSWFGVTTSTIDLNGQPYADGLEHVILLNFFTNNNIVGTLPSQLGNLTKLRNLIIRQSQISGSFPDEIWTLQDMLQIQMIDSQMSGSISPSIQTLQNLQVLDIRGSNFSGTIPDLTVLPNLQFLNIQNNLFQFGDFENEFSTYQSNINSFSYTPQKLLTAKEDIALNIGESTTINANVSGSSNTYFWFKRDPNTGGGFLVSNDENFTLTINSAADYGNYWLEVSNSSVINLLLTTPDFTVGARPTSHPDYNALEALYNSTNGQSWNNNSGWLNNDIPISSWFGITETNNRVTEINIQNNGMFGSIPSEISQLSMLTRFDVASNFIEGTIPTEFGSLPNLTWLDFRNNRLTGSIPQEFTNLNSLFVMLVSNNNLSGAVPDFTNLTTNGALDFLWIDNNQFVFADFENEFSTYTADIGGGFIYNPQQFIDEVRGVAADISETVTLTSLPNLGSNLNIDWYDGETFDLLGSGETFDVTINSANDYGSYIYFVTSLTLPGLGLQSQPITIGPDPSTHPDYDALIAIYNALDGPNWTNPWDITAPIKNWDQSSFALVFSETTNRLNKLELGARGLSGTIPPEIGDLTELTFLSFFVNDISGEVPIEIWNLSQLTDLFLGAQDSGQLLLSSGIPSNISNMQNLNWLNLTGIPLSQPLQPELFNLPSLTALRLENCGLTGTLPNEFASIFNLRLNGNDFVGPIPQSIINSSGNLRLAIANNFFDFTDLEPLVQANNITVLELSPQRTRDEEQDINSAPGADITLDVNDTDIGRNNRDTAMNNLYQWYKDGNPISGADQNTYTIFNAQESDSGIYYCEITNSMVPDLVIRRADINLNIDDTLTLEENNLEAIKIYPNPVTDWLTLKLNTNSLEMSISIFDINGKKIYQKEITTSLNAINLSDLNAGVYLVKIKNSEKTITRRLIKQ